MIRFACRWLPLLLLCAAAPASACSSFASYADTPLYGMNFDYPASTEIRFVIESHDDLRVFHLQFFKYGQWIPTVGMNSAGLFISDQILEGQKPKAERVQGRWLYPGQLYRHALSRFTDVAAVREYLQERRLVSNPYLGLHLLIADSGGDALIAEVGVSENALTEIEGDAIVMTNFSNEAHRGRACDEMSGVGAERYRIICEGLAEAGENVDVEHGFRLLAAAVNRYSAYPTRCSLICDPARGEIYIVKEGDFQRIWKVSLADGTIATHLGFAESRQWPLDSGGVPAKNLD